MVPIFAKIGISILPALDALSKAILAISPQLGELARILFGAVAQAIVEVTPALVPLAQAFVDMAAAVAPLAPQLAGPLADALTQIAPALPDLADAFVKMVDALLPMADYLPSAAAGLANLASWTGPITALGLAFVAYKAAMVGWSIATGIATGVGWAYFWMAGGTNSMLLNTIGYYWLVVAAKVADIAETVILTGWIWGENAARAISNSTLGTAIGVYWLEFTAKMASAGAWVYATAMTVAGTVAAWAATAATWAATAATTAWGIATWILNGALAVLTSPITLIIAAVALLVAGVIYAYTHFDWFRNAVDAVGSAIASVAGWVWNLFTNFTPLGLAITHLGDIWWALTNPLEAARAGMQKVFEWAQKAWDIAKKVGGWINPFGDTATSHGSGGGLGNTMAWHSALAGSTAGNIGISNALVGGGGLGRGSGDHQAGRALDLVGSGLPSYATKLRSAGGFAEFHGSGPARHLHAVYPAGDTATSRVSATSSPVRGGDTIVLPQGAITVYAQADLDIETGVRRGIEAYMRDRGERA